MIVFILRRGSIYRVVGADISFIHSDYFYSAPPSLPLLKAAPDTARILCWSFNPKRQRQLRVNDLPNVSTWRLAWDLNPRPSGRKTSTLPMSHQTSPLYCI